MSTPLPSGWAVLRFPRCGSVERLQAKALCSGTSGGDARGCRVPLGGVAAVLLSKSGLRVKTLDRFLGLDDGDAARHFPPEGVVMEYRFPSVRQVVISGHFRILS